MLPSPVYQKVADCSHLFWERIIKRFDLIYNHVGEWLDKNPFQAKWFNNWVYYPLFFSFFGWCVACQPYRLGTRTVKDIVLTISFFLALDGGSSGHSYDVSETISSSPTAHSYDGLGQSQEAQLPTHIDGDGHSLNLLHQ